MSKISLFYGDEDFLIDEELKRLKKDLAEFNYERIDGSASDIEGIVSALSSMPMLGGERLVIVDNLEYAEEDEAKLFDALKNLSDSVKVIFVYYGSVDKRRKFFKLAEKLGEVKEFRKFTEWEQDKVLAWMLGRVKHHGKKIGSHAANLLMEIVGLNLRMLDKEIEKISTYIGDREMIEEGDVSALASSGEMNAFSLSNALRDKDLQEAVKSLNRLFKDNEDPQMLIGMLAKLYRMLLQVKYLESAGKGQSEIASTLRSKPYFVKKCMEKTGNFKLEELIEDIKLLRDADLKIKSGYSPRLTLEMLMPELCRG